MSFVIFLVLVVNVKFVKFCVYVFLFSNFALTIICWMFPVQGKKVQKWSFELSFFFFLFVTLASAHPSPTGQSRRALRPPQGPQC